MADPTPHPLPWTILDGWVAFQASDRYNPDRPYALHLGQYGGVAASLTADELRQLRDRIDAALAAPARFVVAGGGGRSPTDPGLAADVRAGLDRSYAEQPNMELALAADPGPAGQIAARWAVERGVRVLTYPTVADAVAGGGTGMLLPAGPDALDYAHLASDHRLVVYLIRPGDSPA